MFHTEICDNHDTAQYSAAERETETERQREQKQKATV